MANAKRLTEPVRHLFRQHRCYVCRKKISYKQDIVTTGFGKAHRSCVEYTGHKR